MSNIKTKQWQAILLFTMLCEHSCISLLAADNAGFNERESQVQQLLRAAQYRTTQNVSYDGRYIKLSYPNGDVPANIGVCTDVIIRSYRQLGIDLQQLVHEDMQENFEEYPNLWGHKRADPNIDHRRVPNLQVFFARHGQILKQSTDAEDYQPGDLVTWMLPGNLPHIGILVAARSIDNQHPLVIHNVGSGPELSDFLFSFPITGHYRYFPPTNKAQTESASGLE